jgi:hypothetical protein
LIAGRIELGGDQLSSSLADIKAGKINALHQRVAPHRGVAERADRARAGLCRSGRRLERILRSGEDAARHHRAPAEEASAAVRQVAKRLLDTGKPVGFPPPSRTRSQRQVDQFRPIIRE